MKKVLLISLLFFCLGTDLFSQQAYDSFDNTSLIEALDILESKNQIVFSYDNEIIENKNVSLNAGDYSLQKILELICVQASLHFEFIDNKYVLLTPLANYNKLDYLCGYIKDGKTGEAIQVASVYTESFESSTETDSTGYFRIDLSAEDKKVLVSYLGYSPFAIELAYASNSPCQVYNLIPQTITFETVILKEYLADGISQTENANTVVIKPQEMDVLPGSVEKDALAAISFLPGITSPSESLDGIFVRGGTPDQNLILWDGIPLYHTSHFFGTISAFNPNIIDRVNIFRSGIGSEYGGRVSSVIDIHSKQEITKKFRFGAGFNLTHLHFDFDIPLWKNSSLMISTRRSITDAWNTPTFVRYAEKVFQGTKVEQSNFNDPDLQFSDEFRFNDANLKWSMDYGKNKFRFISLGTLNSLNYKTDIEQWNIYSVDQLDLTNAGANLLWERQWNDRYKTKLEITNAEYKYDYDLNFKGKDNNPDPGFSFISNNSIADGGLNWNNEYVINDKQELNFGYEFTENQTGLDISVVERNDTTSSNDLDLVNRLHALYGEYSLDLPGTLQLNVGLRYLYQDVLKNNYFEPRIAFTTDLTEKLKLKASTGKHFQFVSQLVGVNTNTLGFNNQIWVTANNAEEEGEVTIPVIESNQWMGGFIYQNGSWTIDVEGYVKELAGVTTFTSNFVELNDKPFSSGNSRIRGIDFLLKKRMGRYRSWISYSLSRTKYEFPDISLDPILASHDQTHIFKWVHLYQKKQWEFSLGIEYRSGLPATPASIMDGMLVYGEPNSLRLKRYFRIDGSIIYNFGAPGKFNGFLALSLQNLNNRTNILGRNYIPQEIDGSVVSYLEVNERGLKFTPNISVNIRMN